MMGSVQCVSYVWILTSASFTHDCCSYCLSKNLTFHLKADLSNSGEILVVIVRGLWGIVILLSKCQETAQQTRIAAAAISLLIRCLHSKRKGKKYAWHRFSAFYYLPRPGEGRFHSKEYKTIKRLSHFQRWKWSFFRFKVKMFVYFWLPVAGCN